MAGAGVAFAVLARLSPPAWIDNWQVGAVGEQRTARELNRLGPDWVVLHDVPRKDGTNFDHIVIGPPGVFVLDTKNVGTEVRIDDDYLVRLRPDGSIRGRTKIGPSARYQARVLSGLFSCAGVRCWVHAVVVIWGDLPEDHVRTNNVDWITGRELATWLTELPTHPQPDRIRQVADHMHQLLARQAVN